MIIDIEQVKHFLENTPMTMYNLSQELGISRTTLSNLKNDPNSILTSKVITIMEIQNYINKGETTMTKQYLNDLLGNISFDVTDLNDNWKQDDKGFYTINRDEAKWFSDYAKGVEFAEEQDLDTMDFEYDDYIALQQDKERQDKARQEVEEYLANYGNSHSTHMDSKFHIFKSDVVSLAKDVEHGNAYVYTKYEWLEFLQELLDEAEDEHKEYFENRIKEFENHEFDVLIDSLGSEHQYMV